MTPRLSILLSLLATASFAACATQDAGLGDGDGNDEEEETASGSPAGGTDDAGGPGPGSTGAGNSTGSDGGAGQGGAPGTGASQGAGGETGVGAASGSTSGSGGSAACHDLCEEGDLLDPGCDPCAATVCAADPYCCDTAWDSSCIEEVASECNLDLCGGGSTGVAEGDLVITEIMNNPKVVTDANGEWFELYNASGSSIDLNGLVIRHQEGDPAAVHTIASSVIVPAGGYVVLGVNDDPTTNGGVQVDYTWPANTVNLSNTTDFLAIETADATPLVIDQTSWTELSGLDPDGASRNLAPASMDALDNDDDANFCAATSFITGSTDKGSPGAPNDPCP